ncbi:methyltransferase domain-containing protein [Brasilonema sp. CT11]|nr:methyltransferase domain-containing protein [Brasilonema sp. CT11]
MNINEIEYQKMAEVEETLWWHRALHELVLARLLKLSKDRGLTILDAGAGTGGLLSFLKQHRYYQIRGFDISPYAINYARRKGISLELSSLQEMSQRIAPQLWLRNVCSRK